MQPVKRHPWVSLYGLMFGVPSFILGIVWSVAGITAFVSMLVIAKIDSPADRLDTVTSSKLCIGLLLAICGVAGLLAIYRMAHAWLKERPLASLGSRWWVASLIGFFASFVVFGWLLFQGNQAGLSLIEWMFLIASVGVPLWPALLFFWRLRFQRSESSR